MTKWRVDGAIKDTISSPGYHRGRAVVSSAQTRRFWVVIRRPANDNPMTWPVRLAMVGRWLAIFTGLVLMVYAAFMAMNG